MAAAAAAAAAADSDSSSSVDDIVLGLNLFQQAGAVLQLFQQQQADENIGVAAAEEQVSSYNEFWDGWVGIPVEAGDRPRVRRRRGRVPGNKIGEISKQVSSYLSGDVVEAGSDVERMLAQVKQHTSFQLANILRLVSIIASPVYAFRLAIAASWHVDGADHQPLNPLQLGELEVPDSLYCWEDVEEFAAAHADRMREDPPVDDEEIWRSHLDNKSFFSASLFEWVYCVLWYLAKGHTIRGSMADAIGLSSSTCSVWSRAVLSAFASTLFRLHVHWPPSDSVEWELSRRIMFLKSGCVFPDALGAIDDSFVSVCVSEEKGRADHITYKKSCAIAMQVVATGNLIFCYADVGQPGKATDRQRLIWGSLMATQNSSHDQEKVIKLPSYILGDAGFWPPQWWLPTNVCNRPDAQLAEVDNSDIALYNSAFSHARVVVEQAFGVLFATFRSLQATWLGNLQPGQVKLRLQACIALHNFRIRHTQFPPSVQAAFTATRDGTLLHKIMVQMSASAVSDMLQAEEAKHTSDLLAAIGAELPLVQQQAWRTAAARTLATKAGASRRLHLIDAAKRASIFLAECEAALAAANEVNAAMNQDLNAQIGPAVAAFVNQHVLHGHAPDEGV